jgi:hypothetical protein
MAIMTESPVLKALFNGGNGILHPHIMSQWALRFNPTNYNNRPILSRDCFDLLSMQIIRSKIDLKNNVMEVELEQPKFNYEFFLFIVGELIDAANQPYESCVSIELLDPNEPEKPFLLLDNCKLLSHDFELSYKEAAAGKKVATHTLKFTLDYEKFRSRMLIAIHDFDVKRAQEHGLQSDGSYKTSTLAI